jgi:hypothetical protein
MGSVWQAWDEVLLRTVAVKQLEHQPGASTHDAQDAVNRAMREARITARLNHPNAVPVYDLVEHDGRPCLIMQYVPSRSLDRIISESGTLDPATVASVGADVASALAAAHRAGVVHRDVKPSNVLITEDGTAKLTDFGVSHAVGDVNLTATGMVTGTPAFLAPEVARGARSDTASDVFSLGATLYDALEGQPPFGTGANPMATLHLVASGQIIPPRRSGALTALLTRMLAADPADRPRIVDVLNTLTALRDDLDAVTGAAGMSRPLGTATMATAAFPVAAPVAAPVTAATRVGAHPPRRKVVVIAAIAVVALAATVAIGLLTVDGSGRSSNASSSHHPVVAMTTKSEHPNPTSSGSGPSNAATTGAPTSQPATATPTAAQLASAIIDYYALMPDNTDAGWNRLTPHFQQTTAHDRDTYDSFWGSVDQISASDASGAPPDRAVATLTYTYNDGRVIVERTAFRLVPDDGVLKIDGSSVLSSKKQSGSGNS